MKYKRALFVIVIWAIILGAVFSGKEHVALSPFGFYSIGISILASLVIIFLVD